MKKLRIKSRKDIEDQQTLLFFRKIELYVDAGKEDTQAS